MVAWPLLDDHMLLLALQVANLGEVREEVRPHDMVLVDVGALDLAHGDEVVRQQQPVVVAYPSHFAQALIRVEEQLFSHMLQLLRLLCQHVFEGLIFVFEQLCLSSNELVLGSLEAPPGHVLCAEESLLAID